MSCSFILFARFWGALVALLLVLGCQPALRPELLPYFKTSGSDCSLQNQELCVTFLGTSSLLFRDGSHSVLVDGYFSRPSLWQLLSGPIGSDPQVVKDTLKRLNLTQLDALVVMHSHFDHALDIATIAVETGAQILGSESTAQIAIGSGVPSSQIKIAQTGQRYHFGAFTVVLEPSQHMPLGPLAEWLGMSGKIEAPLQQPSPFWAYREGQTYAVIVQHPQGNSLLHGIEVLPHEANGSYRFDTVFLTTPGLNRLSPEQHRRYFETLILKTQARRIVPVHWDDFTLPLSEALQPLPRMIEDLEQALKRLEQQTKPYPDLKIELWPAWEAFKPRPASSDTPPFSQ